MVKGRTTISIDNELLKIAQEKGFNVSAMTERAIIEKYHKPNIDEVKELRCSFCGNVGETENIKEAEEAKREANRKGDNKHPLRYSEPIKLTWLWPDEKFICNRCLERISNGVTII